jgi:predicted nucleic-acid-binding Zn-ribbon protein
MDLPTIAEIPFLSFDELTEHKRLSRVNHELYLELVEHIDKELLARSPAANYKCMKCGHSQYEEHRLRASQGGLGSFFGVESAQYTSIVCTRCKFSELYQGSVPIGQQALDFVFGR